MFQKWLIAFLADRGWRYLQQRRTRQRLGRVVQKRSRKQAKRMQRERGRSGFKPGRALALMALGAGAYAYVRSRQQSAWNDRFSPPPTTPSSPTDLTASAAAPVTPSIPEPNVSAPHYNTSVEAAAPATLGDTAMLVEAGDTALSPNADAGTPVPDAPYDPLVPAADAPTYVAQSSLEESDTLAVPAANPEDDEGQAVAPTYNAQTSLDETTLAVPAANPEDEAAAGTTDTAAFEQPAATDVASKEAPDDQRI